MCSIVFALATFLVAGLIGCAQQEAPRFCTDGLCREQADEMLRHVVLCSFKPDATTERIEAVEDAFCGLSAKVAVLRHAEWGTEISLGPQTDGFTHCFVVSFLTETERDRFLRHPAHQEFTRLLTSCAQRIIVFDYWAATACKLRLARVGG